MVAALDAFKGMTYEQAYPEFPDPCAPTTPPGPSNPYYFTGRRLDFHLTDSTSGDDDLVLYHYRARAYDALNGRFLQRDPAAYVDGMNLYEYVSSKPTLLSDPLGLYDRDTHEERTRVWALSVGMRAQAARLVGKEDNDTDSGRTGWNPYWGDQSRHFNKYNTSSYSASDSRSIWMNNELANAQHACEKRTDEPRTAAQHLGRALHSAQDWWAHGDYFKGKLPIGVSDRHGGPSLGAFYDVWNYDAATTSDGRGLRPRI